MLIPVGMKIAGREPAFVANLGFASGPRGTVWAWLLALILATSYACFSVQHVPEVASQWDAFSWLKVLSIVAAFAAGIVEESIFRRLIMDALARTGGNAVIQVAASAAAFGLAHGTWGLLGGNLHAAISAAIATTFLGTGLGIVYLVGGRSLAPCIVAHFLIDAVIEPGLLLSATKGFHG